MRKGKFKIYKAMQWNYSEKSLPYWWFTIVAGNGKVIATSQMYKTKRSCLTGIASTKHNAYYGTVEEVK